MRTVTLTITIWLLLVVAIGTALAQPTTVAIERAPSHGPSAKFRIHFGTNTGVVNTSLDVGTNDLVQLTNGPWGRVFASAVEVVTNAPPFPLEIISPPSNEILITNRPAAPMRLRILPSTNAAIRIEGTSDGAATWIHLATVTSENAPVTIRSASRSTLFRTSVVPPSPRMP